MCFTHTLLATSVTTRVDICFQLDVVRCLYLLVTLLQIGYFICIVYGSLRCPNVCT